MIEVDSVVQILMTIMYDAALPRFVEILHQTCSQMCG